MPRLAEEQWQCWEGRSTSLSVVTFGSEGMLVMKMLLRAGVRSSPWCQPVPQSPCAPAQPEEARDHCLGDLNCSCREQIFHLFQYVRAGFCSGCLRKCWFLSCVFTESLEKGVRRSWLWCEKEAIDSDRSLVSARECCEPWQPLGGFCFSLIAGASITWLFYWLEKLEPKFPGQPTFS